MHINSLVKRVLMAGVASAALCTLPVAQAGILIPTGYVIGSETFTVIGGGGGTVAAGGFQGTWDGSPIQFWCAELTQTFNFNPPPPYYTYTASIPNNAIYTALGQLFHEAYSMALSDTDHSAAFQLAIWEILFNGDLSNLDLHTGTFQVTNDHGNSTAVGYAQGWLAALGNFSDNYTITKLSHPDHQDFITHQPPGQTPEPGPLALIGIALVGMLVARRRRPG